MSDPNTTAVAIIRFLIASSNDAFVYLGAQAGTREGRREFRLLLKKSEMAS
jgi:hypothetical protein